MALEISLQACCGGLTSVRATERRKSAENLKDFLSRDCVPSLLSKNTNKKEGYTWNNVFDDINEFVLKEVEKYGSSKTYDTGMRPLCSNLLSLCVSGSNKGKAYIECTKIMDACLHILKNRNLTKAIGDAYLNLLYKHVLPCDYYSSCMTLTAWDELLKVYLNVCVSKHCNVDDFTKMKLLLLVMRNGKNCCQITIPLRDSLAQLKTCLIEVLNDKIMQEIIIEIMILLLETLSSEYRLTICEFTESLLSSVLQFYDQNVDQKKKSSLFKLLHLAVMLHHPHGALQNEAGSLAHNWGIWNKQLHIISEIVCLENAILQKHRKQNDKLKYSTDYYCLAASVYYQIFNIKSTEDISEIENTSKRPRVSFNKSKSFGDLIEELRQNHVPWLEITHMYLKNNSQCMSNDYYLSLILVIESLMTNHSHLNWSILEDMSSIIIRKLLTNSDAVNNEHEDIFMSFWNLCVRTSTLVNAAHKVVHSIMQLLLRLYNLKYVDVQPLIKLYFEKTMPVTDDSVKTLSQLFCKFFSKCSNFDDRLIYFTWLTQGQITSVSIVNIKEILLRLLATENFDVLPSCDKRTELENLHEVLFGSIDKCMLFGEFQLDIPQGHAYEEDTPAPVEINPEINMALNQLLRTKLTEYIEKLQEVEIPDCIKFISMALAYLDIILKNNFVTCDQLEKHHIYCLLNRTLINMYVSLTTKLKINEISQQIKLLRSVREMLMTEYDPFVCAMVRVAVNEDFFKCINILMNLYGSVEDREPLYDEDDEEMSSHVLRNNCIYLLAAFCRKRGNYRHEILSVILDSQLYNFDISWDVDVALECIEVLNSKEMEDPPLEAGFKLMLDMCQALYRNSKASYRLLKILLQLLDRIWLQDSMRKNCFIMVKGYLHRCGVLYYPPHMAALVYECAAKIAILNLKHGHDVENNFEEAIIQKIKGDTHSIRLYCCYLMKLVVIHLTAPEIESYSAALMDIFIVKVSEPNELILKDESANRTLTILHGFFALAQIKSYFVPEILTEVIQMQQEKALDVDLVKMVLNKITHIVAKQDLDVYLNDNILSVLNYWYTKNNTLEQIPIKLFGFDKLNAFVETHLNWLIGAEILWRKEGVVTDSYVLKYVQDESGKSVENIIEACICNIIVLCLPYIVTQKYKLDYTLPGKSEWIQHAAKMFESSRQILGAEKWSSLFADNLSELVLLTATHLSDCAGAKQLFQVDIPQQTKSYQYPKEVFLAILKYLGELIDANIVEYLCEIQPVSIFNTLFQLWINIEKQKTFEFKVLAIHTFITFFETVPLNNSSDIFVCNFACNSLGHAIKNSRCKQEITVLIKALRTVLDRYLLGKEDILRNSVFRILSILMIKKEEGFVDECASLLSYLASDMKGYLTGNEDVVDFVSTLSQGVVENAICSTKKEFMEKLNTYKKSLTCPSHQTLLTMRQFFINNKHFVRQLSEELNSKGFSDDCGTSTVHQIVHTLSNTMKSASDEKTKIEACNCLIEIANYDFKTLVTVPPPNTQKVTDKKPRNYFAIVAMQSLSDILFGESPTVTSFAAKALKCILKYREAKNALDLEEVDKQMLKPFCSSECKAFAEFKINDVKFNFTCGSDQWIPNGHESHTEWLTRVTVGLLDVLSSPRNYLMYLRPVCVSEISVCRKILPPLVGLLLDCSPGQHIQKISAHINLFFQHIWDRNFGDRHERGSNGCERSNIFDQDHKMMVQYMLDIVNFVRLQKSHYKLYLERTVETLNYLRLEYDKVAWSATVADQNVTAIYYGELWALAKNDGVPPVSPEATSQLAGGENLQSILRKSFVSIGELDAVDGCGTGHLTTEDEKLKHLFNTGQFSDALLMQDIALSCGGQVGYDMQYGTVKSLHKSGMHHLALQYIKSLPETDELNDIKYECLSFLGDWSDFVDTRDLQEKAKQTNNNSHSIIKAYRYSCLKDCLNIQTTAAPNCENKLVQPLNRAKLAVARLCQNLNMEVCQSVYKVLSKLHLFSDIDEYFSVRCEKLAIEELLNRWQVEKLPAFHDFKHLEAIIAQRSLMLEHAAKAYNHSLKNIVSLQLEYTQLSLCNERVQMAQRLLAGVKKLQMSHDVALVDSQISWAKGHRDIALSLLRNIVNNPSPDVRLTAISLRQYGMWMAESKCDNAREIINKYLKKSLEVLRQEDHKDSRLKVYFDIAKFADAEYKQVVAYMNSSIFENKVKCLETMKDTVCSLRATQQSLSRDERKALAASDRFGKIDEAEIAGTRAEKESFLRLAMRYYLLSLKHGEGNNLSIFRVISLWLDNPSLELTESDQESFEDLLHSIPSRKFITVLPQLGPRLANEQSSFAKNLNRIIKRCAVEHPHHTLPILFNLKNSDKDKVILNASKSVGGSVPPPRSQEARVLAADGLVAELARHDNSLAVIIEQMEKLCDATISLANFVPTTKETRQKMPSAERIHTLGPLDAIPLPTDTIAIRNDCKYTYLPTLQAFEGYFELVGGINCPKKVTCRRSDGQNKILLIKGEDDLRQDAVMQQVFNIVNTLLEKNPVTSRNKLLIRTYKVVPMSRRSGVLEWCEGTMPIGLYLIGNSSTVGAHSKYRPKDISSVTARSKLGAAHEKRKSNQEKLAIFLRVLREFRPVFHYFFTEHYLDPVTWYERRLAYTKSVATSSMVGYILGLGDRHLQNILIDKKSAEVVHIDFGIAFDQGKTLPTPETIPFRLTQDIIAGFGPCGVEGIFRRCCEKTMQLLRDNQETLLTILEVLLCDPLYSWKVTSKQQNILTATSRDTTVIQPSGSEGSLAQRALLTVSSKLSGTEGGAACGVAVPGQVVRLVRIATDPANLCRLYPGWQPYL